MTRARPVHGRRAVRRSAGIAAGLALVVASAAVAQDAAIVVEPSDGLPADGATLSITGSGFSTAGNGVYVVFGPITPAPGYYLDPGIYGAFRWVHAGATDSSIEAPLADDGSFDTTLEVTPTFDTPQGEVDCAVTACGVITFAAHGSPDRGQDTCVAVSFAAAPAGASMATPSSAPTASPITTAGPAATPSGDACSVIGGPAAASPAGASPAP
jgi:hypothetical protein